ncbi:MAG: secretion protein HlyD [Burkholderiaceae bacterium]|nr:secretion protein HlyD [Burkholderiaceae bacterium]
MNRKYLAPGLLLLACVAFGAYTWMERGAPAHPTLWGNVDIREVSLAFRVAGRVEAVMVDEGDRIHAGQVLARLDTAPLDNAVRGSEAQWAAIQARNALLHQGFRVEDIEQANARLEGAKAALADAEAQWARQKTLVPAGAASQKALDAALAQRDQAAANLAAAQAQQQLNKRGYRKEEIAESDGLLAQAKANLDTARLALSDAVLLAPSDGMILTRAIEKGAMVQVGGPAFSVSLTQPVWVRAYVPETQMGLFSSGTQVQLHADTHPDHPYHGVVGFVSPTAEFAPKSVETADLRTSLVYRLRIVVQDADAGLSQGMPVTINLLR